MPCWSRRTLARPETLKYPNHGAYTNAHLVGYLLDREPRSSQPHDFIAIEDPAGRKIGLFGPGAAALAPGLSGRGYEVVGISSEAAWGKASNELVKLIYDPDVIGVVATDRASAHLAKQIAVKALMPVLAISADRTLTSANLPWIFRLDPGTAPADAVRCFREADSRAGGSRDAIRAQLASGTTLAGRFSFTSTGEPR